MLPENLKDENYYLDKLSLFMRNSHGIVEQFEMFIALLQILDEFIDEQTIFLDITKDETFLAIVNKRPDVIDKYLHFFGFTRHVVVSYVDDNQQTVTKNLTLKDFDAWILIKAQILQNYYDGSYAQARDYYRKLKLPVYILTEQSNVATAAVYFDITQTKILVGTKYYTISQNIKDMFLGNLLTIRSMGIQYNTQLLDLNTIAIWDSNEANRMWDVGVWSL